MLTQCQAQNSGQTHFLLIHLVDFQWSKARCVRELAASQVLCASGEGSCRSYMPSIPTAHIFVSQKIWFDSQLFVQASFGL